MVNMLSGIFYLILVTALQIAITVTIIFLSIHVNKLRLMDDF